MHVIRLRRPWQKTRLGDTEAVRIDVPEPAGLAAASGTYLYARNFHRPSGISPTTRVFLRVESWQGKLESASLNDHSIPLHETQIDTDVSTLLEAQNRLVLRLMSLPDQPARLAGGVTLALDESDSP